MSFILKNAVVLGSGVMGSRIACHLANAGLNVLLLDILPGEPTPEEKAAGLTMENPLVRNRIASQNLMKTLKGKIPPLYKKEFADRIDVGNFEDHLEKISGDDWIIEAIIEDAGIKNKLFEKVEQYRKENSIVSTNTSGIPINILARERSEGFNRHFLGTHFFNPPRFLPLLEIIPNKSTSPEVLEFMMDFGDRFLGKTTIRCKDTPAFIANRTGVYAIMLTLELMEKLDLSVEEVDALTGPLMGRPKSATFRTADLVGIDVLTKVANGLSQNLSGDDEKEVFKVPSFVEKMVSEGKTGDKGNGGFYKKIKTGPETEILSIDRKTLEYKKQEKPDFSSVTQAFQMGSVAERIRFMLKAKDKGGEFFRLFFPRFLAYTAKRIPEIADNVYQIDQGLKAGFDWKAGPFLLWDRIGSDILNPLFEEQGIQLPEWVRKKEGKPFYKKENGELRYLEIADNSYQIVPSSKELIILENFSSESKIWSNEGATLYDIGDGVVNLEFHTKGNSMGSEVLQGINKAIDIAEKDFKGLVIGNQGNDFSVGANLGLVFMLAIEQEYDELHMAVSQFQNTMLRVKYCNIPVIVAPHGKTLGGGTELCLHADMVQAAAETYMGLVEVGVGLIPAGGGSKEMIRRAAESYYEGDPKFPNLQNYVLNIAQAKVSMSAHEGFDLKYLKIGRDRISMNKARQISDAKRNVLGLAEAGYMPPVKEPIKVLGKGALALFLVGINSFYRAKYATEHDKKINEKLAYVMCGGDLSDEQYVSEQYLLDLEREAFLSLIGEKKTLQRIESILKGGKPLRN